MRSDSDHDFIWWVANFHRIAINSQNFYPENIYENFLSWKIGAIWYTDSDGWSSQGKLERFAGMTSLHYKYEIRIIKFAMAICMHIGMLVKSNI